MDGRFYAFLGSGLTTGSSLRLLPRDRQR